MHPPFPEPEPDSDPRSEAHWLYKWQRHPQALDAPEFREKFEQHYLKQEAVIRRRNDAWWHILKANNVFLGSNRLYYIAVLPTMLTQQKASATLKRLLPDLDADFQTLVAYDLFGKELLGFAPWPKPPDGLAEDFDEPTRGQIKDKSAGPDAESDAIALWGEPQPAPAVVWLYNQVPARISIAMAPKLSIERRLEWVQLRMHHMGMSFDGLDLEPTLANFIPFFRVLNTTFPDNFTKKGRFETGVQAYLLYGRTQKRWKCPVGPDGMGGHKFLDFDLKHPTKWPAEERARWDLLYHQVVSSYCVTCARKNKAEGDFGNFCSLKCIPRRCCGGCMKELTSTEVVEYRPTRADSKRSRKISDLTRVLALRPEVEAIARAPKCCWVSKSWLNRGEPTLKEEPCADCDALPLKRLNFEKEFYLKGVWSEDWPAVQRELDKLRAIPREPPQKFTFHEFGCKTPDCPEPGRLVDHDCDDFTFNNRKHAKMMAEFDERQKKRARHE
jgi:hypothetical protein